MTYLEKLTDLVCQEKNIEKDYNQFDFMDFINVWLSLFKFWKNIDDADFLIHLIKETTLSSSEQEKFNDFIKDFK